MNLTGLSVDDAGSTVVGKSSLRAALGLLAVILNEDGEVRSIVRATPAV